MKNNDMRYLKREQIQKMIFIKQSEIQRFKDSTNAFVSFTFFTFYKGLFIFLSFAASGKALELYRSKLASLLGKCATETKEENMGNANPKEKFACRKAKNPETEDTPV